MKKLTTALVLFIMVFGVDVFASGKAGTKSAVFIYLPSTARASSLKNAVTASSYGSQGVFYNPAMLSYGASEVSFMHKSLFAGINNQVMSGVYQIDDKSAVGMGLSYVDYGSIDVERIDINTKLPLATGRRTDAYGLAVNLAYSHRVNSDFSVGANFKIIREEIDTTRANSIGFGFGVYYEPRYDFRLGFVVDGIATKMKYEKEEHSIPIKIAAGLSYNPFKPVWIHADLVKMTDDKFHLNLGTEYLLGHYFAVRLGGTTLSSDDAKYSVGLGFNINNLSIDYAFVPGNSLESVHTFGLKYAFRPLQRKEETRPPIEVYEYPERREFVYRAPAPEAPPTKHIVKQHIEYENMKITPHQPETVYEYREESYDAQPQTYAPAAPVTPSQPQPQAHKKVFEDGRSFYNQGDWARALVSFKQQIEVAPDPESYYYAGMCYVNLSRYDKAIEQFNGGLTMNPSHYELNLALATSYFYLNDFRKSVQIFQNLQKYYPDDNLVEKNLEVLLDLVR